MTKNEALKAAIDGKKVKHSTWRKECFLKWNGHFFEDEEGEQLRLYVFSNTDWQIVPEYVDFAEAWKAYEQGKAIQCKECGLYLSKDVEIRSSCGDKAVFSRNQIRGKWLILEDE